MSEPNYTSPDLTLVGEDHVRAYRESGGEVGYIWNGVPTLLLTVTGRRTGRKLTSALIFGRDGDDYLVEANPQASIQVKADELAVVAQTASATEKPRLWKAMTDIWPNYDAYQSRTDRDIPVVVLRPT